MHKLTRRSALAAFAALGVSSTAFAEEKKRYSAIYVTDMHCTECARKIARKLYAVPGVVQVKANVPKDLAFVIHQKNKDPDPRALWQAVEDAGFEVVKIHTPNVVLTEKPRASRVR